MKQAKFVLKCFETKPYFLQSFPLISYELLPIYQYEFFSLSGTMKSSCSVNKIMVFVLSYTFLGLPSHNRT